MKKIIYIIVGLIVMNMTPTFGQNNEYLEIAKTTIATFRCSINAANFTYYGLTSEDELEKLTIGEAIPHFGVPLNRLQRYTEAQDPNDLIQEMGYVTVSLVNANNNVTTFVMMNNRDGNYNATGIGKDYFSEWYLTAKKTSNLPEDTQLIRVPALNKAFASVYIDEKLHLVALSGERQKSGNPRLASEVFVELSKMIQGGEDVPH